MKTLTALLVGLCLTACAMAQVPFRTGIQVDSIYSRTLSAIQVLDSVNFTRYVAVDTLAPTYIAGSVTGLGDWGIGAAASSNYGLRVYKTYTAGTPTGVHSTIVPGANSLTATCGHFLSDVSGGYTGLNLTSLQTGWSLTSGTATTLYGLKFGTTASAGSATTSYFVYAGSEQYVGTTHYNIYMDYDAPAYLKGRFGLGRTPNGLYKLDVAGSARIDSALSLEGKVGKVANVSTEGNFGVPAIVDTVVRTNSGASIGATNFSNTTASGIYRISVYLAQWSNDVDEGTVSATISWRSPNNSTYYTYSDSTDDVNLSVGPDFVYKTFVVRHDGSAAITWQTTTVGLTGDDKFAIWITVERLN